jgi:hypothetical protein
MQTLNDVKKRMFINLQDYPEIALRYQNGDPLAVAMLQACSGMIADQSVDLDLAIIEPFMKSNVRTILADATNKGILPIASPCRHYIDVKNKGVASITISAGRYIEDAQGRIWRLLQTASVGAGETVKIEAEQSQIRTLEYQVIFTEPFLQVELAIQEDLYLCGIRVFDSADNNYTYRTRWMNCAVNEYAFNLKTDSTRSITAEFGDSERCGVTVQANTILSFELSETDGDIDISQLREASLQELHSAAEAKVQISFSSGGLVKSGTNPLSIDKMRLLSSYPTHDENAVFLGDFDYNVRKAFMSRCSYLTVWNEATQDKYYGATLDDMNHMQVAFVALNESEAAQIGEDISAYIGRLDSLYKDRVHLHQVDTREFELSVNARLAPVHNVESIKEQIYTLLLSRYGRDSLATSYFLPDGFNLQEIADAVKKNIPAFQDHISDFSLLVSSQSENLIKPHQWLYMTRESIKIKIERTATTGANLWTG